MEKLLKPTQRRGGAENAEVFIGAMASFRPQGEISHSTACGAKSLSYARDDSNIRTQG